MNYFKLIIHLVIILLSIFLCKITRVKKDEIEECEILKKYTIIDKEIEIKKIEKDIELKKFESITDLFKNNKITIEDYKELLKLI